MTAKRFKFVCDDENCFFKCDDKVIDCLDVVCLLNEQEALIEGYVESMTDLQEEKDYWKKRCLLVENKYGERPNKKGFAGNGRFG